MYDIAQRLLAWGGEEVVWTGSDAFLLQHFPSRGEYASGEGSRLQRGEPSQCHFNSALNLTRQGWKLATGWALSADGLWRVHSWNIDDKGGVVETTERRTAYAGVVLTDAEALQFAFNEGAGSEVLDSDPERWVPAAADFLGGVREA